MAKSARQTRLRENIPLYRPTKSEKLKKIMKQNEPFGDQINLQPMIELLYYIYEKDKTSEANEE